MDISTYDHLVHDKLALVSLSDEDIRLEGRRYMQSISPEISWGHSEDWAASSILMLAEKFTVESVKKELTAYKLTTSGITEGLRGIVFWIIASTSAERSGLSERVKIILEEALKDEDLPVIVVLPSDSSENLIKVLHRRKALSKFSIDEKEMYKDVFNQDQADLNVKIHHYFQVLDYDKDNINKLRQRQLFLTNPEYAPTLLPFETIHISKALNHVYNAAYRFSPPVFLTEFKENTTNLKTAVKIVSLILLTNSIATQTGLTAQAMNRRLIDNILTDKWGILHPGSKRIQKPTNARIREVWNYLDDYFSPVKGEINISQALIPLLNPPYGYDFNTLTLLFCAWFGYNAKDLQISANGVRQALKEIVNILRRQMLLKISSLESAGDQKSLYNVRIYLKTKKRSTK